jgi:dephospho-CoA kinase
MTNVIGLTGGIGSGKSTVSQILTELGAVIIDADKVGHEAFKPGTPAWREVMATFGKEVIAPGGEVDRKKLGSIVFGNPEALLKLNRIMHPKMADMMRAQIDEYRRQGLKVIVLDAAILIEANWTPLVDEVWLTVAPESKVLERLKKQRGMTEEQTLARIRSQLSTQERMRYAKVVINNDGDIDDLKAKIKELWQRLNSE